MELANLLILFLGGCLGGVLAGLLGIGGGLVFVVIFTNYLMSLKVPDAGIAQLIVANSMFAIFFAGLSGTYKHYKNGNFYPKPVLITGVMAALCSMCTMYLVHQGSWYNKNVFTAIVIFIVSFIAYKILFLKNDAKVDLPAEQFSVRKFFFTGTVGGTLASLSGIGGGIIMVPMLTRLLHIDIKKATAISLGVITITSLVLSFYLLMVNPPVPVNLPHTYGLIVLPMALPVALGCTIFSPVGVNLAKRLSEKSIQIIFALFLLVVIFNMIYNLL
ncbi:MAG TPA: sulfite exporter TauE/SafE family protein [Daejeonella sp.]|nr:sulfite exporter TauE/SafE family protein [Daejeonella sp.]